MAQKKGQKKDLSVAAQKLLRGIPKVDEFLNWLEESGEEITQQAKTAVREVLEESREAIIAGRLTVKKELSLESLKKHFQPG